MCKDVGALFLCDALRVEYVVQHLDFRLDFVNVLSSGSATARCPKREFRGSNPHVRCYGEVWFLQEHRRLVEVVVKRYLRERNHTSVGEVDKEPLQGNVKGIPHFELSSHAQADA
jgi:hypothetical protein